MEMYYSKKEYNDMKRAYEKKIALLERQVKSLSDKLNKLKNKDVAD